jgi:hypothetical protein
MHDKYTFVGHVVDNSVNDILEQYQEDDAEEDEGGLDGDITSVADQAGTEAETGQI